jgi:hypothetical protein
LPASAIIQAPTLIGCLVVKERSANQVIDLIAPGIAAVPYLSCFVDLAATYCVAISESYILHCFRNQLQLAVASC